MKLQKAGKLITLVAGLKEARTEILKQDALAGKLRSEDLVRNELKMLCNIILDDREIFSPKP